jgi:hypothetical protein
VAHGAILVIRECALGRLIGGPTGDVRGLP